jgi:hypothetical protein
VLSAQHTTIWMVVLPPLSGFSTLTVRRPMVASTMVPRLQDLDRFGSLDRQSRSL